MVRGIGKDEPLSVAGNGAKLAHTLTASKEHRCLQNILYIQSCRQVAVFVADFVVFAGTENCQHATDNGQQTKFLSFIHFELNLVPPFLPSRS